MTTVELFPSSLPLEPAPYDEWREGRPTYLSAYNLVLNAEHHANEQLEADPSNLEAKQNRTFARVAGYFLLELFNRRTILSEIPCVSLVKQLVSLPQSGGTAHDVVFKVGKWHFDLLIPLFRTSNKKYQSPSLHPSRPSFDTLADMMKDCMEADENDYRTAKRKALARDGFRCMVTGAFDRKSVKLSPELDQERRVLGATFNAVHACHILGESIMQGIDPTGGIEESSVTNKTEHAACAMAVLKSFGCENLVDELLAKNGVHNLGNLLSLTPDIHGFFDNLELWFEGTEEPNRYKVCVFDQGHERYLRRLVDGGCRFVTFTSSHKNARPPEPKLLALHAACARVVRMSGAAEAIDELERDVEETRVLAFDGSSARLLDHLITPFAIIPGVA